MVNMEVLDIQIIPVEREQIILARDRKGNWLHKDWCLLTYYEKEGCPTYNKCKDEPLIYDVYEEPFIFVCMKLDYKRYLEDMKKQFKNWSDRKLKIPYLWQKSKRKQINEMCDKLIMEYEVEYSIYGLEYMIRPEINGVFVIASLLRLGLDIQVKPIDHVYIVNLIGKTISNERQGKIGEYF